MTQQLLAPVSASELDYLQDELYVIRSIVSGIADRGIFAYRRLSDREAEAAIRAEEKELRDKHLKPVISFVEARQKDLASMDKRKLKYFGFHGIRACRLWLERRREQDLKNKEKKS